jgi:hypothetical protein
MKLLASGVRAFVTAEPVDLRRGHDGLSALVRSQLSQRSNPRAFEQFTVSRFLRFLWRSSLVALFVDTVYEFATSKGVAAMAASAVLLPELESLDARVISSGAALSNWGDHEWISFPLPDSLRARVVLAAPEAWANAIESRLNGPAPFGEAEMLRLLRHLPFELKARVGRKWAERFGGAELPWRSDLGSNAWRPADRARWILYELGIEAEVS